MSPLLALGEGLRRVSAGDLEARIEVPADDEIGVVVEAFHGMTDELRSSRAALETSNQELSAAYLALDAERAQIAAILENLGAGVVALDGGGRVVSVNGAAQQMLRIGAGDLVGRTLDEAFAGDPRHARAELAARAPAQGTMIGTVSKDHLVMPKGARAGDRVIITKGVPIEATAILAARI